MKKRRIICVVGTCLMLLIVLALLVPGIVFPPKWRIQKTEINGSTVYELRRNGNLDYPRLLPGDSPRLIIATFWGSLLDDTGHDYIFDLSNFEKFVADPGSCATKISTGTNTSSFSPDGTKIVWDQHPASGHALQKIRGFDLISMQPFDVDTRPELYYKSLPTIDSQYVVYQGSNGEEENQINLYDIAKKEWKKLTLDGRFNRASPVVSKSKIIWTDARNIQESKYDIYGFDLETYSEFCVTRNKGDQYFFKFNGRYVLFPGDLTQDGVYPNTTTFPGLFLFDTLERKTIEIEPKTSIITSFLIDNDDDPLIAWEERIANDKGTFFAIKYKKISEKKAKFITDPKGLRGNQHLHSITESYIAYSETDDVSQLEKPYIFSINRDQSWQLDNRDGYSITINHTHVFWKIYDEKSGDDVICGRFLP